MKIWKKWNLTNFTYWKSQFYLSAKAVVDGGRVSSLSGFHYHSAGTRMPWRQRGGMRVAVKLGLGRNVCTGVWPVVPSYRDSPIPSPFISPWLSPPYIVDWRSPSRCVRRRAKTHWRSNALTQKPTIRFAKRRLCSSVLRTTAASLSLSFYIYHFPSSSST